tara:strand:- start:386 stop:607 length:222 start_codon:yes stop_codon:yes gene_type:complete
MTNWTHSPSKKTYTSETGAMVKHNGGGWGRDYNYRSTRKWAAFDQQGAALSTSAGSVRTFKSSEAAMAAADAI